MKTLEAYLIDAEHKGITSHAVSVSRGPGGEVRVALEYADAGHGSEFMDFEVRGDTVSQPFMTLDAGEMLAVDGPELATKLDIDHLRNLFERAEARIMGAGR